MAQPNPMNTALQNWIEVFMKNSMKNLILYCKENGLSMSQMGSLNHIFHKGSSGVSDIGDELGVSSAAASQMLERMVQEGLILRSEDPLDRRLKRIVLTPKGQQVMQDSVRARQKWLDALVTVMTPAEQEQVTAAINILIEKAYQLEKQPEF